MAVLALATALPAAAQSDVLELEDLLATARSANPTLQAARLEAEALATRPRRVSALPDPQGSISYRPFAIDGIDGAAPVGVMVTQTIPYPGKRSLAADAARQEARVSTLEADELLLEIEYQIRDAYYALVRIQEQDRLIEEFQARLSVYEDAASAMYEVGTGTQQAILKAQLERTALERRRLDLAAERRMQLERLARLTNRPDLVASEAAVAVTRPAPIPIEDLNRPAIAAAEAGIAMSEVEVARAKREYLPDFMVGAGIMDMMGPVAPFDDLSSRFGIEIGVVIPLQRGRRDAALDEARLRRSQSEARLEALRTEIATETNELRGRIAELERALTLYRDILIPQAETTLEATLSAYTTGRSEFLDLLDAQRMSFDLRIDYEDTYADLLRTQARLARTLGIRADTSSAVSMP